MNEIGLRRGWLRLSCGIARRLMGRRSARVVASGRVPPRRWRAKRRLMACVALAAGAFALASHLAREWRAASRTAASAQVEALERQVRESRAELGRLPHLREAARARAQPAAGAVDRSADARRGAVAEIAALAARTGVTLRALEPVSDAGASRTPSGKPAGRALRIDGRADFASVSAFVRGLQALPMLVVPESTSIKREADVLGVVATLNVFDAPYAQPTLVKSAPAAPDAASGVAGEPMADPFGLGAPRTRASASMAQLVGLLHDGRRSLVLFAGASGAQAAVVAPGEPLGSERIVRIDTHGVVLASRAGTRRIVLSEDAR